MAEKKNAAWRCIPLLCCWLFAVAPLVGNNRSFRTSWGLRAMSLCRISLGTSPGALAQHLDRNTAKWLSYQAGSDCAQQVRLHWADQDISGADRITVAPERVVSRMFERACVRACVPAL
eukprot:5488474-Alexandrium_andersonii.AAC.1